MQGHMQGHVQEHIARRLSTSCTLNGPLPVVPWEKG
jgi:hypothetical protein